MKYVFLKIVKDIVLSRSTLRFIHWKQEQVDGVVCIIRHLLFKYSPGKVTSGDCI